MGSFTSRYADEGEWCSREIRQALTARATALMDEFDDVSLSRLVWGMAVIDELSERFVVVRTRPPVATLGSYKVLSGTLGTVRCYGVLDAIADHAPATLISRMIDRRAKSNPTAEMVHARWLLRVHAPICAAGWKGDGTGVDVVLFV